MWILLQLKRQIENTVGNGSYKIVQFGDWMLHTQMKLDALRCNVELDSILDKSLNILDLHNGSDQPGDMAALLKSYELEVLETEFKAS